MVKVDLRREGQLFSGKQLSKYKFGKLFSLFLAMFSVYEKWLTNFLIFLWPTNLKFITHKVFAARVILIWMLFVICLMFKVLGLVQFQMRASFLSIPWQQKEPFDPLEADQR